MCCQVPKLCEPLSNVVLRNFDLHRTVSRPLPKVFSIPAFCKKSLMGAVLRLCAGVFGLHHLLLQLKNGPLFQVQIGLFAHKGSGWRDVFTLVFHLLVNYRFL